MIKLYGVINKVGTSDIFLYSLRAEEFLVPAYAWVNTFK